MHKADAQLHYEEYFGKSQDWAGGVLRGCPHLRVIPGPHRAAVVLQNICILVLGKDSGGNLKGQCYLLSWVSIPQLVG